MMMMMIENGDDSGGGAKWPLTTSVCGFYEHTPWYCKSKS